MAKTANKNNSSNKSSNKITTRELVCFVVTVAAILMTCRECCDNKQLQEENKNLKIEKIKAEKDLKNEAARLDTCKMLLEKADDEVIELRDTLQYYTNINDNLRHVNDSLENVNNRLEKQLNKTSKNLVRYRGAYNSLKRQADGRVANTVQDEVQENSSNSASTVNNINNSTVNNYNAPQDTTRNHIVVKWKVTYNTKTR